MDVPQRPQAMAIGAVIGAVSGGIGDGVAGLVGGDIGSALGGAVMGGVAAGAFAGAANAAIYGGNMAQSIAQGAAFGGVMGGVCYGVGQAIGSLGSPSPPAPEAMPAPKALDVTPGPLEGGTNLAYQNPDSYYGTNNYGTDAPGPRMLPADVNRTLLDKIKAQFGPNSPGMQEAKAYAESKIGQLKDVTTLYSCAKAAAFLVAPFGAGAGVYAATGSASAALAAGAATAAWSWPAGSVFGRECLAAFMEE